MFDIPRVIAVVGHSSHLYDVCIVWRTSALSSTRRQWLVESEPGSLNARVPLGPISQTVRSRPPQSEILRSYSLQYSNMSSIVTAGLMVWMFSGRTFTLSRNISRRRASVEGPSGMRGKNSLRLNTVTRSNDTSPRSYMPIRLA